MNSIYGPQYSALDQQITAAQQAAQQQAAQYNQWAQQQADALAKVAPQVQQLYGSAANSDAVFAKGFSDALTQAQQGNADQINKILAQNGAPQGQMQTVNHDAADVLYGLSGYLPATTLTQQGAAYAAAAAMLPANALSQGRLQAQGALRDGNAAIQQLQNQRFGIDSNKAQSLLSLKSSYADNATKQAALKWEQQKFDQTYGLDVAKAKQTAADRAADRALRKQGLASTNANRALETRLRFASIFGADPTTGQPTLAARKAANADKKNSGKYNRLTPYQRTQLIDGWQKFADDAYNGVPAKQHYDSTSGKYIPDPSSGQPHIDYYTALRHLLQQGAPLAQAQQILNTYYPRGVYGRPYVGLQGRTALKRAGIPLPNDSAEPTQQQVAFLRQHGMWGS